nr:hypothetical protein CFP56_00661 [Quercus suber]
MHPLQHICPYDVALATTQTRESTLHTTSPMGMHRATADIYVAAHIVTERQEGTYSSIVSSRGVRYLLDRRHRDNPTVSSLSSDLRSHCPFFHLIDLCVDVAMTCLSPILPPSASKLLAGTSHDDYSIIASRRDVSGSLDFAHLFPFHHCTACYPFDILPHVEKTEYVDTGDTLLHTLMIATSPTCPFPSLSASVPLTFHRFVLHGSAYG